MFTPIVPFLSIMLTVQAVTETAIRNACLSLDGVDGNQAIMHEGACYVIPYVDDGAVQYQYFYQNLARCNHMPHVVGGHLLWMVQQSQMKSLESAFKSAGKLSPFDLFPHMGLYRFDNKNMSASQGWYFVGHTMNETFGPLPDVLSDDSLFDVFADSEPNHSGHDDEAAGEVTDMVVMSIDHKLDDQNIGYLVLGRSTCQYDPTPMNVQFCRTLKCNLLDITRDGVQADADAKSEIECVRRCVDRGVFCMVISFDDVTGCRYGLLINKGNLNNFCDNSATDGRVLLRIGSIF